MALVTPQFPIDAAEVRSLQTFDAILTDWGVSTIGQDQFPPLGQSLPFTPSAVAIGPLSTVDRCWISWNPSLVLNNDNGGWLLHRLSLDTPLIMSVPAGVQGPLPSGPTLSNQAIGGMVSGQLLAFPSIGDIPGTPQYPFWPQTVPPNVPPFPAISRLESTVLPTVYIKADGTQVPFGTAPDANSTAPQFAKPILHLRFYLREQMPQTFKRAPLISLEAGASRLNNVATEYPVAFYPTFGRKNIIVMCFDNGGGPLTYRIGALRGINASSQQTPRETTEGLKTGPGAGQHVRFQFCGIEAEYLIVYAANPAALGSTALTRIFAYD